MKSPTQKLTDIVMVAVALILGVVFYSITADAQLKPCHSGHWSIDTVETNLDHDYDTAGMGVHLEYVAGGLYVGTFNLNDGWLTALYDDAGVGVLQVTTFEGFVGRTIQVNESAYFIPETGEAGFSRPGLWDEFGIWHCVLSDYCVRQFTVTQLTFPQGVCDE